MTNAAQAPVYPEYQVHYSSDLQRWTPLPGKVRPIEGRSGPLLSLSLQEQPAPTFFRVDVNPDSTTSNRVADGGAEVFGYNAQFTDELSGLGYLSLEDFATNAPPLPYLARITWDPTTAQFWTNFNSASLWYAMYGDDRNRTNVPYNYRLDDTELALFLTNGFVVSERMGTVTFADAYYRLFNAELPVFITADSILHAWHRSYQSMLSELEELAMAAWLERVLTNMSTQLPQTWQQYGAGPLRESILDADYCLTVARSLWAGKRLPNALQPGEPQRVVVTLTAISNAVIASVPVFGANRMVDFSQFKVRGHYDASERLRQYFRTLMWCSRMDLRLATFPPNQEDDIRQLGTAVVMHHLLGQSGQFTNWWAIEEVTRVFVGFTDSMTFPQFGDLLANANIQSPAGVPDLLALTNLQTRLLTGELGVQSIQSDHFWSPLSPEQVKLPRSFTVLGQKFVMDSWALSQVVFDRVLWDYDDPPRIIFGKVIRRKPSCLDAAFSVLRNDQVVPEIISRISNTNGVAFRDGLPYHHNLLAVRNTIDGQQPAIWTNNIYTAWLAALRSLSAPTTDPSYPQAMRTRPWAMKTLNTQLASWTELRHDTLLYAKQSYTAPLVCGYPAGFVEPRPEFWAQMEQLARNTALSIGYLPLSGQVSVSNHLGSSTITVDLNDIRSQQLDFLFAFSERMRTLQDMATRELAQQPLTSSQTDLLKNVVERSIDYVGVRRWNGWYPSLYYTNALNRLDGGAGYPSEHAPECDIWDPLVADVHTDLPDEVVNDPGAVIHEGVGNVHLMLIAVDNGPDRVIYAGPVSSHYEFELPGVNRLSDSDWKTNLRADQKPPQPEWTRSYLVPGSIFVPPGYN